MLKRPYAYLLLLIGACFACESADKELNLETKTRAFYTAMATGDLERLGALHLDSVRVSEGDYHMVYSLEAYGDWLAWDAVFKPTYELLEIQEKEGFTEVVVSKACKRILFLNEAPIVTRERLYFEAGKIQRLEILEFLSFNDSTWNSKRAELVSLIEAERPALKGFLTDQTRQGGLNYIEAIDWYEKQN